MNNVALPFREAKTEMDLTESNLIIRADEAHSKGYDGSGITVAILDTGVNSRHPMLRGRVIKKIQIAEGDIEDGNGHGTHVAGIVSSVAPGCNIINVKVLDDSGTGDFSNVMMGIEEAIDAGADIINMSLGGYFGCYEGPICNLISGYVGSQNILFAIAAGNNGPGNNPSYPSLCTDAISVGATDSNDYVVDFSSQGPACSRVFPDVSAPGVGIESAWLGDSIKSLSGTSMATPQVSGLLAMLTQSKGRRLSMKEIREIMQRSCKDLYSEGKDNISGWGRIDVIDALNIQTDIEPPVAKASMKIPIYILGSYIIGYNVYKKLMKG